jgi:predicted permease
MGFSGPTPVTLGGDAPQQIVGTLVTCNYFRVLQLSPVLGPGFPGDCDAAGAAPTVVLGHDLWNTAFGADPAIVGREVLLNQQAFTVVGVAPEGMRGVDMVAVSWFAPISTSPLLGRFGAEYSTDNWSWLSLIGRKADDMAFDQVRAELGVIAAQIDQQQPPNETRLDIARASRLSRPDPQLVAAGGVVIVAFGLVLLIACANVANLLLARATRQTREIAVRVSLGASRARVVQQLLAESVLIALIGGLLGSVLAMWFLQGLVALALEATEAQQLVVAAVFDMRVFSFAFLVTLASGILFGLAPALQASKPDLHTATKVDGASHLSRGRLQSILLGVQVAVCMVLMISAGLLLRGLYATQTVEPGFEFEDVAVASFDFTGAGYDAARAAAFQRQLVDRVDTFPGVDAVARARFTPLGRGGGGFPVRLSDQGQPLGVRFNNVSPGYFSLVGIPIVRGRTFAESDLSGGTGAVIVTEATARRLWPDRDSIGQTLMQASSDPIESVEAPDYQVIGVAQDAQITEIGEFPSDYLYLPASPDEGLDLIVRSGSDFAATAAGIRSAAAELDSALIVRVSPLEANLDVWRSQAGLVSTLSLSLGALAPILASVGVYGVVAFAVHRRVREIGIRMALGANARSVLALMLKRTLRPVIVDALIGLVVTAAFTRVLSSVLFGVSPFDPVGMGGAAFFVASIAVAAAVLAAWPATRSDPLATLRYE